MVVLLKKESMKYGTCKREKEDWEKKNSAVNRGAEKRDS
jgi:hypothetical protein